MPSALAFIGGGLLEGIGKGLVESGKAKRERALADLEHTRALERDEKRLEGRRGLLDTKIGARIKAVGMATGVAKDAATTLSGRQDKRASTTADVATTTATELNKRKVEAARLLAKNRKEEAKIKAEKAKDTTAAEDRIIKRHVTTDENGLETINREGAATELESRGFKKAAQAQRRKGKAIVDQDIRTEAEAQADAEVDEKAGTFSTDAVDFKEDGGSRIRFRARRVREIKAERSAAAKPGRANQPKTREAAAGQLKKDAGDLSQYRLGTKFEDSQGRVLVLIEKDGRRGLVPE